MSSVSHFSTTNAPNHTSQRRTEFLGFRLMEHVRTRLCLPTLTRMILLIPPLVDHRHTEISSKIRNKRLVQPMLKRQEHISSLPISLALAQQTAPPLIQRCVRHRSRYHSRNRPP